MHQVMIERIGDYVKYPEDVECSFKDRESLFTICELPVDQSRITNLVESTFGTIRHRTQQAKGCMSRHRALHLMFRLGRVVMNH